MEVTGITRLIGGKEVEQFVVGCSEHNYWYKGAPPLTSGCRECWHAYFFAQIARSEGDKYSHFQQLESAIRHVAESVEKGEWDFKPDFDVKIDHEKD